MSPTQQVTARYFFRYRAPTRISFSDLVGHQLEKPRTITCEFPTEKVNIVLFDERLPTEPMLHYGVGFAVEVEHPELEEAQSIARATVVGLIAVLSFCEACYVGRPEFVARYRIPDSGNTLHDALVFVLDRNYAPVETSLRIIQFDRFQEILKKIHVISDERRRNTILRSLNWFWMSLDNNLHVDSFLHLWIALELLEVELKALYSLDRNKWAHPRCRQCNHVFKSCPNCTGDFTYRAGTGFVGLKKVVVDCGLKKKLYDDLYKLRSKLIHGVIAIPEEIRQAVVDTRELLTKAVFTLIDLDPSRTSGLASSVRLRSNPTIFYLEGTIDVSDVPWLSDVYLQPTASGQYEYKFQIAAGGKLVIHTTVEHKFQGGAFVSGRMEKKLRVDSSINVEDVWEED